MEKMNTKKCVYTALLAALTCVATMSVRIPTPGTGGYIHPGDAIVILSGVILGPVQGFLAAGLGSAAADLFGGYFIYAPLTLVIKGVIAFLAGHIYKKLCLRSGKNGQHLTIVAICGIVDMILVPLGYFLCELPMYGLGAISSIPANFIQGLSGMILAVLLYPILMAASEIRSMANNRH